MIFEGGLFLAIEEPHLNCFLFVLYCVGSKRYPAVFIHCRTRVVPLINCYSHNYYTNYTACVHAERFHSSVYTLHADHRE